MSEHAFLKRRWKLLVNVATVVALLVLMIAIRDQLVVTLENFRKINGWVVLLVLPIQMINYHAQTKLYQGLFEVVGNKLSYSKLYKAALELNFVNNVFPSAGVAGISYFGMRLRNGEITGGRATLIHIMKLFLLLLSFEVLLIAGLCMLAIGDKANDFVLLLTSSFTTLMVVGTVAFVMMLGSQRRINTTFTFLTKALNRLLHIFLPGSPETINIARAQQVVEDLHVNYKLIETRWRQLKAPFFWALIANMSEIASIYVIYIAFGELVNVGAVILAYAVANFAGLVSVLPGGVGVFEALMTATLVAAGVPAAISLPVTIMHRVINTLVQVPPGYILYHRALHAAPKLAEIERGVHE